jgi:hypothetical protein
MPGLNVGASGITMDDKMMNLSCGWFVVYKDNSVVTEEETDWGKVRKGEIKMLGLKWFDKFWTISGKTAYIQFKRGSVSFSPSGISRDIRCEERCIGYYEGNKKVIYRVNERTGRMTPEVRGSDNG